MDDTLSEGLKALQDEMSTADPVEAPSDETIDVAPSESGTPENVPIQSLTETVTDGADDVAPTDQSFNPTDRTSPDPESHVSLDELTLATTPIPSQVSDQVINEPRESEGRDTGNPGDWPNPDDFDLASQPLADFEHLIFPPEGSTGHKEGEQTLSRVVANLMSAGYEEEPWRIRIAASLWGRRTYGGGPVEDVRKRIERAPVAEIIACVPKTEDDVVDKMRAEAQKELAAEDTATYTNQRERVTTMAIVSIASLIALTVPLMVNKRS
jgi:hypothetical protein